MVVLGALIGVKIRPFRYGKLLDYSSQISGMVKIRPFRYGKERGVIDIDRIDIKDIKDFPSSKRSDFNFISSILIPL